MIRINVFFKPTKVNMMQHFRLLSHSPLLAKSKKAACLTTYLKAALVAMCSCSAKLGQMPQLSKLMLLARSSKPTWLSSKNSDL